MSFNDLPAWLSPDEAAANLRVPPKTVLEEIEAGRLNVVRVGGELRIRKEDLLTPGRDHSPPRPTGEFLLDEVEPAPAFRWKWPSEKGTTNEEQCPEAFRTRARISDGRVLPILIGVTQRTAAGKERKRILVVVDGSPVVEFVGGDDPHVVAGIVKPEGDSQRHLRNGEPVPPAYESLDTRPYNEVVRGPHASSGIAVVCDESDYKTMILHALIRWTVKKDRGSRGKSRGG